MCIFPAVSVRYFLVSQDISRISVTFSLTLLLPLGGGPPLILARHLQHRAEDGREREETADGP